MYRWVYQVMLRCYLSVIWDECQKCTSPMDVQKNVGEFLFFLGCFSELGRHFNGLHASPRCEWIDCISHCAIVCCPNHISVGQRRKCWLIIQHGSPSSPETTKSGLWLMFSVNSLMAPNGSCRSPASIKWKGGFLPSTCQVAAGEPAVLQTASCAGATFSSYWVKTHSRCGIGGHHSVQVCVVYPCFIMAVREKGL